MCNMTFTINCLKIMSVYILNGAKCIYLPFKSTLIIGTSSHLCLVFLFCHVKKWPVLLVYVTLPLVHTAACPTGDVRAYYIQMSDV